MSTGAGCRFDEIRPGQWTYWLQSWPYGQEPDGQTFGPFPSYARAIRHLDENHANPGGHDTRVHPTGHVHEWTTGNAQVPTGVGISLRIESLGPDPDRAAVIALIRSLPEDHPAWGRFFPVYGFRGDVTSCDACGTVRS